MLQRAASNACSWWWASHVRTKQSKWLEECMQDMEEKVQGMLKLIQEEGDSFAKRAEMYYKRRPELISSVEDTYRAFKALADRYDLLSKELQNANHTIATVFPEQVGFAMDEDDDCPNTAPKNLKNSHMSKTNAPKVPKAPMESIKGFINTASKQFQSKKPSKRQPKVRNKAGAKSGLSKDEALKEVDKVHKQILALQTLKEFVKSSYENGLAKYWDIDNQINEMQEKVCRLQDEYDVETVIEDNEARTLMAEAALKSCQETLASLQEKQENSTREAQEELKKIESARKVLQNLRREYITESDDDDHKSTEDGEIDSSDVNGLLQELNEFEPLDENFENTLDLSSTGSLTVSELAEKIDKLVNKVITLETAVSSQTVLINTLRIEADDLHAQIQNLEDEKESLIGDTLNFGTRVKEVEDKMNRILVFNKNVESHNSNLESNFAAACSSLDHLSEELTSVRPDEEVDETVSKAKSPWEIKDQKNVLPSPRESKSKNEIKDQKNVLPSPRESKSKKDIKDKKSVLPSPRESKAKKETKDKKDKKDVISQGDNKSQESQDHVQKEIKDQKDVVQKVKDQKDVVQEIKDQRDVQKEIKDQKDVVQKEIKDQKDVVHEENIDQKDVQKEIKDQKDVDQKEIKDQKAVVQKEIKDQKDDDQKELKDQKDVSIQSDSTKSMSTSNTEKDVKEVDRSVQGEVRKTVRKSISCLALKAKENLPVVSAESLKAQAQGEPAKENEVSWQQMLLSGTDDREKILLKEYTTILRNYKDVKKRLTETEKKDRDIQFDITLQMRELKQAILKRDQEIQQLRQKLSLQEGNNIDTKDESVVLSNTEDRSVKPEEVNIPAPVPVPDKEEDEIKLIFDVKTESVSVVEEKLRMEIDAILDENLDFWLRFSTTFHQVHKFKSEVKDLRDEVSDLRDKKQKQDGAITTQLKSEARPIYKHLREIQTELTVWLEQSVCLKDELKSRFSSLCSIQEEITTALKEGVEEDEIRFSSHQAAKLQGEILNMKQENNKVREELQMGLDHVRVLEIDIEKTLRQLNYEFGITSDQPQLQHSMSRARVPLKAFIFGTKEKKQKSLFSFMHANRKFPGMRPGLPPPRR